MGVRKYATGWSATKSVAGKCITVYKPTKEEAEEAYDTMDRFDSLVRNGWATKTVKRSNAKAKDLPVGFIDTFDKYTNRQGETKKYRYLRVSFVVNRKVESISCVYGSDTRKKLTRDEALLNILRKLNKLGYQQAPGVASESAKKIEAPDEKLARAKKELPKLAKECVK